MRAVAPGAFIHILGMLEGEGTFLFCMAADANVFHAVAPKLFISERPMGIMTVGTENFMLCNRVAVRHHELGSLRLVTLKTHFRCVLRPHLEVGSRMNVMAV